MKPIVWVEGNIGAGKTTLTKRLAESLKLRVYPEPISPYLEDFYQDPQRWAFPMQIDMLRKRYHIQKAALTEMQLPSTPYRGAILDRGMPGDKVFATLHHEEGNISDKEYTTYNQLFDDYMMKPTLQPALLILLDVEPAIAVNRIKIRSRTEEATIPKQYLEKLCKAYNGLFDDIYYGTHRWWQSTECLRTAWNVADESDYEAMVNFVDKFLMDSEESCDV